MKWRVWILGRETGRGRDCLPVNCGSLGSPESCQGEQGPSSQESWSCLVLGKREGLKESLATVIQEMALKMALRLLGDFLTEAQYRLSSWPLPSTSYWLAFSCHRDDGSKMTWKGQDLDLPEPTSWPSQRAQTLLRSQWAACSLSSFPNCEPKPPVCGYSPAASQHLCAAAVQGEPAKGKEQLNSQTSLGRQPSCIQRPLLSGYLPPLHVLDLSAFHLPPCSFGNSGRPIEASRLGDSWRALAWSQGAASHPAIPVRFGKGLLPSLCVPDDTAGSKSAQTGWRWGEPVQQTETGFPRRRKALLRNNIHATNNVTYYVPGTGLGTSYAQF